MGQSELLIGTHSYWLGLNSSPDGQANFVPTPPLHEIYSMQVFGTTAFVSPFGGQTIVLEGVSGKSDGSGGRSETDFDDFLLVVATDGHESTQSVSFIHGMNIDADKQLNSCSSLKIQATKVEQFRELGYMLKVSDVLGI